MSARHRQLTLLVFAGIAAGCADTRALEWSYTIDPALEDVALIEARVRAGGCEGEELLYDQRFARGDAAPAPMTLAPGTYGVEVSVRNGACEIVGRRCVEVELPLDEGAELVIGVEAITPEAACVTGTACVEGRCEGEEMDAGTDAGGATDAGGPSDGGDPLDGGGPSDGGVRVCDCEEATDTCEAGRCVPMLQAEQLAMGGGFGCAIATVRGAGASQVYCWGNGPTGQLGIGCVALSADPVSVAVPSGEVWTDVESVGHTCVVSESGRIFCWGQSSVFQAGPSATCSSNQPMPFEIVSSGVVWADVGVADSTTCAITTTGARYCSGRSDQGRLGNGTSTGTPVEMPTVIADGLTWESLAGGSNGNFYGTIAGGEVYFFGWNDAGQTLPTGASTSSPVRLGFGVERFGLGRGYGCQVETGGRLSCWGCSSSRALTNYDGCKLGGLGLGDDWLDPDPLGSYAGTMARRSVVDADARAVGAYNSSCAVIGGRLSCWGPHENGILGLRATPAACSVRSISRGGVPVDVPYCSTPQLVDSAADDWVDVDVGSTQACAIRDGGRLYCWGRPTGAGSEPVVTAPTRMVLR